MRRIACLGVFTCLMTGLAWHQSAAIEPMPRPDGGMVANEVYTNNYFHLSYPLPSGWTQGIAGPDPSHSGYYVLATFIPAGELSGTILIAAQDVFFAGVMLDDAAETTHELVRSLSRVDGMTIDRQPSEVRIGGRIFSRVDFSGVGLFRSTFFSYIRCHLVSFNLTANSPELRAALVLSLNNLGHGAAGSSDPVCIRNRAGTENVLTKVDPAASGPTFTPIPVRVMIGANGAVKHVHVIRATPEQRDKIEHALGQWKFNPHEMDGRAAEIETGLLIEFTSAGTVTYSVGGRR
jgi:hypothetical protein